MIEETVSARRPIPLNVSRSIGFKLIVPTACILMGTIGILGYKLLSIQEDQLIQKVIQGAERTSDTIRRSTRYDMLHDQRGDVREIIKTIGEQPGIDKIRIFNKEGRIMISTDKRDEGKRVDENAEACYACHAHERPLTSLTTPKRTRIYNTPAGRHVLGMITPIPNEQACASPVCHPQPEILGKLGVLDIVIDLEQVDADLVKSRVMGIILIVLMIAIVGTFMWFFTRRTITKPLRTIVRGVERVGSGDLEHKIRVRSGDELGYLADSFNQMTGNLSLAKKEIEDWGHTLEAQVVERTAELVVAQQRLVESEKLASMGQLSAGVAHEINNPLGTVLLYSHSLLKDFENDDTRRADLEMIVSEADRCRNIVRGLLDFARESRMTKAPTDLKGLIEEVLAILAPAADDRDVRLVTDLPVDLSGAVIDANQMRQVLVNLVQNGLDATSPGGEVRCRVRFLEEDGSVEIRVEDDGCGVPEENLTKLFTPFFTTKETGKGTGLGLAIVYGIVKMHSGDITVESEVGRGTKFTISLPVGSEGAAASPETTGLRGFGTAGPGTDGTS